MAERAEVAGSESGVPATEVDRCERTWGLFDLVRCQRRKGHDGMCSGMTDHGRIVW